MKTNKNMLELFGIKQMITSAYHPQTKGQAERINQTLKAATKTLSNDDQDNWDE